MLKSVETFRKMLKLFVLIWVLASAHANERHTNQLDASASFVTHAEIKTRLVTFPGTSSNFTSIRDFRQIFYDSNRPGEVFVGARDYLLKLDTESLTFANALTDLVDLGPGEEAAHECRSLPSHPHECHNFVSVIAPADDRDELLVCGTNARRPLCQWRSRRAPGLLVDAFDGMGKSAHSPAHSSVYTRVRETGDFLFATSIDYNADASMEGSGGDASMLKLDYLIDRSLGTYTFAAIFNDFFIRLTCFSQENMSIWNFQRLNWSKTKKFIKFFAIIENFVVS